MVQCTLYCTVQQCGVIFEKLGHWPGFTNQRSFYLLIFSSSIFPHAYFKKSFFKTFLWSFFQSFILLFSLSFKICPFLSLIVKAFTSNILFFFRYFFPILTLSHNLRCSLFLFFSRSVYLSLC